MTNDLQPQIKLSVNQLCQPSPVTVVKLKAWLFQNKTLYKYAIENRYEASCFHDLPCSCSDIKPETRFVILYDTIRSIIDLHQYENYFKKELEYLDKANFRPQALKESFHKTEKPASEDLIEFWLEWYCEETKTIKPFILHWNQLGIKLKISEWKNTIKFLQIFNSLYY